MAQSDPVFSFAGANPFGLISVGFGGSKPVFADIDGDNDLDAFVGDFGDDVTVFFKNNGTSQNPIFGAPVINPFGLAMGGRASDFVDIDGDGDLDGFIRSISGDTLFFKNIGGPENPSFAPPVIDPFELNYDGFVENLTFVDIDSDGDFDVFAGNYSGDTIFLKNMGTTNNPVFSASQANPFGLSNVGRYSASPTFIDIEGDGDLDVFIGMGHYSGDGSLRFYRNVGTSSNPQFYFDSITPFGLSYAGNYTHPTFADLDGDGKEDLFIGNDRGDSVYFHNTGVGDVPHFSYSSKGISLDVIGLSFLSDPFFVDIDGDGDLDAFVGLGSYSYPGDSDVGDTLFSRNIGTAQNPIYAPSIVNPFGLTDVGEFASPTFVDIDNDRDLDAFIGNELGDTFFFKNTGGITNPVYAESIVNPYGLTNAGFNAIPSFVDIDGDHDLDAFIKNFFFENIGTANNPAFAAAQTNAFGLNGFSHAFIDIDVDGDLDVFLNATYFLKNIGTATNPLFSQGSFDSYGLPSDFYRSSIDTLTFADIDGDGDLDAYMTGIYSYASISPWGDLYINNTAPNVTNLTLPENYTRNTPLNLKDIVISDADSASVTASLTLSNVAAGKLSTATSGAVTSSYNTVSGEWKASGAIANVNALLAGVVFTPAGNFSGAFSVNISVSDDAAPALVGSKDFTVMLVSTSGNTVLTGTSSGNNTITYALATAAVTVSLNITTQQNTLGAALDTITAVENLIGSSFADNLTGNSTYNILDGRAGNDVLRGWSGADTMIGGPGNDTMYVENTRDAVIEKPNEGSDTVSSTITYTLPINVEKLILTGTTGINGTGNELANVITGNGAANQLNGQAGNDTLDGGAGNDALTGWSGADTMIGGAGNDLYFVENVGDVVTEILSQGIDTVSSRLTYTLPANVENLTLTATAVINGTGNELANVITGNSAVNQLNGGAGNDTLDGGLGSDRLMGGTGNDVFKFTSMGPVDVIVDYNVANDTIQLENSVFTALTAVGTLPASQFRIGAQALDANDHILYNKATGALIYDANGNAAGGAAQIATIGTGLALTSADIVVI